MKLDKKRELKGYYAVLFINDRAIFFTKLEKDGDIFTNRFATEEIDLIVSLSEVEKITLEGRCTYIISMVSLVLRNLTVLDIKGLSHFLNIFLSFHLWIKIRFLRYINYNIKI